MLSPDSTVLEAISPLEIHGDVGGLDDAIDAPGDVIIHGSIRAQARIRSAGSITVHGCIEAAEVIAQGNLSVVGGIVGHGTGRYIAQGSITTRFASQAHLEAGGNITAGTQIAHCRAICGGRLVVSDGAIVASHVTANGGMRCRVAGSAGGRLIIEAGVDERLRRLGRSRGPQIDVKAAELEKLKSAIAPLVRNQKGLAPQEKERVTGAAVLSFPLEVAIAVASALSGTQLKSLNQDCVDALGEIANMVAGGAKAQMPGTGNKLSLPNVVLGQHRVAFPRGVPIIVIPFDTPAGRFILEIAFKAVAVPAQQAAA